MPTIFDKEGNELAEVTDDELGKLPELLKGDEEGKKEMEELKTKHEELLDKYTALEGKDFNFRKFEKATDEEKEKLLEKMTEMEKASVTEITDLKSKIETGEKDKIDRLKSKAVDALSAGDEDLKKELDAAYEKSLEFGGNPKTDEEVITRMQEAYRYVKGTAPDVNALNNFVPGTPVMEDKKDTRYTDTSKGKTMLQENFPELYPPEKEKKEEKKEE